MDTEKRHGYNLPKLDGVLQNKSQQSPILEWQKALIDDRRVQGVTPGTIDIYKRAFKFFNEFCEKNNIAFLEDFTPNQLRSFMTFLEEHGINPGGQHQIYRNIRTYVYFWEEEVNPPSWVNPFKRVKSPKLREELLDPVDMTDLAAMIRTCDKDFYGFRDIAIFYTLLDTGLRAQEMLSLNISSVNMIKGQVDLKVGKMGKGRIVFVSSKTRKALRQYLRAREMYFPNDKNPALFVADNDERLQYFGLRMIMVHRSKKANVKTPAIHSFRRRFALACLENGMNVFTLQRLMGHADLQVLRRYLKQSPEGLSDDFNKASPVESLF
jgi:integrase/recombinase XerD